MSAEKVSMTVQISKIDEDKRIVYGEVLVPGEIDSQGDILTKEEVERVAHDFMLKIQKTKGEKGIIGKQHSDIVFGKHGYPVESYIEKDTGAWVLGTYVTNDETWQEIKKGEITGYSIGGVGERVPLEPHEIPQFLNIAKSDYTDNEVNSLQESIRKMLETK